MKPKKKKYINFFNCQIDVEAPAYVRTARYAPGQSSAPWHCGAVFLMHSAPLRTCVCWRAFVRCLPRGFAGCLFYRTVVFDNAKVTVLLHGISSFCMEFRFVVLIHVSGPGSSTTTDSTFNTLNIIIIYVK